MNPDLLALARVHGDFWAIKPEYADGAIAYLQDADYDSHLAAYHARVGAPTLSQGDVREEDRPYAITRGVALISIDGPMTRKPTSYGGCSTLLTQHAIRLAGRDQDVQSVLIVFSSPGGSVNGLQELTDEIAAVAAIKPVDGFIPDGAFSAAYYAATAVRRLTIAETAQCGSLGTMMVLVDSSDAAKQSGRKVSVISTGPLKGQGTPGTVPSDEYVKMLTDHAEAYGDFFRQAIATGRKLTPKQVDTVFTGRYWMAKDALALGLVDAIGSLDEAMAELVETTAQEDDDQDEDLVDAHVASVPVALAPVQRAALVAGVSRERFDAGNPTISAPGGQPGSAGNSNAPTSGAESNDTGKNPMRQQLLTAFVGENMGVFVDALNKTTSEDPELLAGIIARTTKAQIEASVSQHPVVALAARNDITDVAGLTAALDRARDGDTYLADVRREAKIEANRAFGPESGPMVGAAVDHQTLAQVKISRDAWRASADRTFGIGKDGSAPTRQSAPSGPVARAEDVEQAEGQRPWDRLTDEQRADALKLPFVGSDKAKQDAFALNLLGEAQ